MTEDPFEGYDEETKAGLKKLEFMTFEEVQNRVSTLQGFYELHTIDIKPNKIPIWRSFATTTYILSKNKLWHLQRGSLKQLQLKNTYL
jgi:hypothetical protein